MEGLITLDQSWTLWINQHHNAILDSIIMPVSWFGEAGVGWILVMVVLLVFGGKRERLVTLVAAGGLMLTEYILMHYCRELWPRLRPYLYMDGIRQMGVAWTKPAFPSAHAHLWVQMTLIYGIAYRRWLWPLAVLTLITLYSRPYAGMHHVLDVVAGATLGGLMGGLELLVAQKAGLLVRVAEMEFPPVEEQICAT